MNKQTVRITFCFAALLAVLLITVTACGGGIEPSSPGTGSIEQLRDIVDTTRLDSTRSVGPSIPDVGSLSETQKETLTSLNKVDDYPLYTMYYKGGYQTRQAGLGRIPSQTALSQGPEPPGWGCTLFTTLADEGSKLYGRNFDWQYSPALLIFTDPPGGYASVSMVDISYLVDDYRQQNLEDLPLSERMPLLQAPYWTFDGMNEAGLAIGMAAVNESRIPNDSGKETIDSLRIMREILDHARDVDEALAIMERYNIDWADGPTLHYLIADQTGRAVLLEFVDGEMQILPNEPAWHQATNFLVSQDPNNSKSRCWRYELVENTLTNTAGVLTDESAISLLADVSVESTQWSIVYDISDGDVTVAIGRDFINPHRFKLTMDD